MNSIEVYRQYTKEIDKQKDKEIALGITKACKKQIDECYEWINGQERDIELELYKRKAVLINDISQKSSLNFNMSTMFLSALMGAVVGITLNDFIQVTEELISFIKERKFLKYTPREILYADFDYKVIILTVVIIILYILFVQILKENTLKEDGGTSFCVSMCEYEKNKIDEILNRF